MIPWFMWILFLLPFIIMVVGVTWVNLHDDRDALGRLKKKPLKKVYQESFALLLDTPSKKARHLKEHREWDTQFYGYIEPEKLIIWNGKVVTLEEADRLYYIEQQEVLRRYENG